MSKTNHESAFPVAQRRWTATGFALIAAGVLVAQGGNPTPNPQPMPTKTIELACFEKVVQPEIAGFSKEAQMAAYLGGLARLESGGRWNAVEMTTDNTRANLASGAYQYMDGFWNKEGGYATAGEAPADVQYRRVKRDVTAKYQAAGGDWRMTAYWDMMGDQALDISECDQTNWFKDRTDKIISYMNENLADPTNIYPVEGLEYNPQTIGR